MLRIKSLIFELKSSTEHNTDFMYGKKSSELNFCSSLKICLNALNVSFCLQNYFFCSREKEFATIKEFFTVKNQKGFLIQDRKGSLTMNPNGFLIMDLKGSLIKDPKGSLTKDPKGHTH